MIPLSRFIRLGVFLFLGIAALSVTLNAQELSEKQKILTDRYTQLEQILFRISEATAASNPQQAVLLRKVLQEGKEKLVALRLGQITSILERKQLTEAIIGQEDVEKDLSELLKLLESANREQKRAADKEKIKEFLRNLEEIIHQERNLKTKTEQQDEKQLSPLEKEQNDVRQQTQTLQEQIAQNENGEKPKSDTPKNSEQVQQENANNNADNNTDKTDKDSNSSPEKQEGQNESEKNPEQQPSSPVQQAMQKALQRMKQAEEKLKQSEKSGAVEEQEEAVAELQRVKAELEKILRQLREEELLQTLEKLESRFKRMLTVEQGIRTKTEKLSSEQPKDNAKNSTENNTENNAGNNEAKKRQIQIQAGQLGADQQTVIDDADAAMILLREDGTAQALAESLLQARFDMTEAKNRLDKTELGTVTLSVEDAVIAALKEMLEAVQLAIEEAEKRKNKPNSQGMPGGGNSDVEPLIQLLSELKMIRSMQQRVNDRTERYDKQILELRNQANPDWTMLRQGVDELARQQNRITRILHDIKIGKTE